ncbi:hypothetical protein ABE237_22560 [Brevibacillus formosus]|uniref:hypothetical protein n=1 Tax=Brevibacillus formosus TaxID=54913 RepID=UPI0018CCB4FF|nr:hypothetical protein [Brevibacillus formosus]MBG9941768.1 hypothetical protein [Brevibacillus formosus]
MNQSVKNLIYTLEVEFNRLEGRIDLLQDVEVAMSQLRDSVDAATHRGVQTSWHHQHHRELRLMSELFRYLVEDISEATKKTDKVKEELLELVKDEGDSVPQSSEDNHLASTLLHASEKEKGNAS